MAWEFVGVSTVVQVTGTSHTLTLPAGVVEGDLLIACFAIRTSSTTAVTRPSDWSVATQSYINQVTANSTIGAASGLMAYCIMGASPPGLGFTHPVNPSVARGQIVAYRNSDPVQASVLDISGFFRLASGSKSISFAGGTTTEDNELLVGVVAGGRNITVTNFNNTGSTSSGTGSNITAAPANNTWQERADAGTATGSDTGLSIFDAVDTVAGSVGTFTATASASARHLTMVAAFKIDPTPPGTTYPQSASITSSSSVANAIIAGKRVAIAGIASVSRSAGLTKTIGLASAGVVAAAKAVTKALAITSSGAASATASRAYLITASIASAGVLTIRKSAGKVAAVSSSGLVSVRKAAARTIAVTSVASIAAQATKAFLRSLSVSSSAAVGAVRSIGKRAALASSGAVSLGRAIGKASAIAGAASVAVRRGIGKIEALSSAGAASVRKAVGKVASVTSSAAVATQKSIGAQRAVSAVTAVGAAKSLSVALSVASAGIVSASKAIAASVVIASSALALIDAAIVEAVGYLKGKVSRGTILFGETFAGSVVSDGLDEGTLSPKRNAGVGAAVARVVSGIIKRKR